MFKINILNALHHLLKDILVHGEITKKDDSAIKEYLGENIFIDNPFPEVYEKPNNLTNLEYFKKCIVDGRFDLDNYGLKGEALADYASAVDNNEQIYLNGENSFVYSYPNRIFCQSATPESNIIINQFEVMKNRLKNNLGTNRSVATIYNPFHDSDKVDIPCLQFLQSTVRHNELILHCLFRSNDIYGAWYGNMLFLTYYAIKLVSNLNHETGKNITFKGIDYHVTSAHIYEINIEDAWKLYKETGLP